MMFIISESGNYVMIRGQDVDPAIFDRWSLKHKIIYPVTNVYGNSLEQRGEWLIPFLQRKNVVERAQQSHNGQKIYIYVI